MKKPPNDAVFDLGIDYYPEPMTTMFESLAGSMTVLDGELVDNVVWAYAVLHHWRRRNIEIAPNTVGDQIRVIKEASDALKDWRARVKVTLKGLDETIAANR